MIKKIIIWIVLTAFFLTGTGPLSQAQAQTMLNLPAVGSMVGVSISYKPIQLKGIQVYAKNPLRFDFLVDKGESGLLGQPLKDEITRLTKYFLTCLTVPERDLWVNLSPYEKDRIAADQFGVTQMGKDLLEQDYLLKQLVASLTFPEKELGERFWKKVYAKTYELYGTTAVGVNTFNKVWILPKSADVFVQGNSAFVVNSQLDVMMEADYKAIKSNGANKTVNSSVYAKIMQEVILPELRKEVNEGKNFALVRQVYDAMILATWYKRHLKDSVLGHVYVGQNKVKGIDVDDPTIKEQIFQQYIRSFKKNVYNYIREDYDPVSKTTIPRKYVSGGFDFAQMSARYTERPNYIGMQLSKDLAMATVDITATTISGQVVTFPDTRTLSQGEPFVDVPKSIISASISRLIPKITLIIMLATAGLTFSNVNSQAASHSKEKPAIEMSVKEIGEAIEKIKTEIAKKQKNIIKTSDAVSGGSYLLSWGDIASLKKKMERLNKQYAKARVIQEQEDVRKVSEVAPQPQVLPQVKTSVSTSIVSVPEVKLKLEPETKKVSEPVVEVKEVVVTSVAAKEVKPDTTPLLQPTQQTSTDKIQPLSDGSHVSNTPLEPTLKIWQKIITGKPSLKISTPTIDAKKGEFKFWTVMKAVSGITHFVDQWGLHTMAVILAMALAGIKINQRNSSGGSTPPPNKKKNVSLATNKPSVEVTQSKNKIGDSWNIAGELEFMQREEADRSGLDLPARTTPHLGGWNDPEENEYARQQLALMKQQQTSGPDTNPKTDSAACAIGGVIRWGTDAQLAVEGDEDAIATLQSMIRDGALEPRGVLQAGVLAFRPGKNGKIEVYLTKKEKSKTGPGSGNFIEGLFNDFAKELPRMKASSNPLIRMAAIVFHTRWPTWRQTAPKAAHPHIGPIQTNNVWSFIKDEETGMYKISRSPAEEMQVLQVQDSDEQPRDQFAVGIGHNGNNKTYRFYSNDREIGVDEMKAIFKDLLHYQGELPTGDSPAIPFEIQFHYTQGDWLSSARFSHVMNNHHTVDRMREDILTQSDEQGLGAIFHRIWVKHAKGLSRQGYNSPEKTLNDLYVTQEMLDSDPTNQVLQLQYQRLIEFKRDLIKEFENELDAKKQHEESLLPISFLAHWIADTNTKIESFVNLTVEKFFTADRLTATREFISRSNGTYGLFVTSPRDPNGMTFVSVHQDVVLAWNKKKRIFRFASHPYAMQTKDLQGDGMEEIFYLNSSGKGEIANIQISPIDGELSLDVYSLTRGEFIGEEEKKQRTWPLKDNPNFTPLHMYKNKRMTPMEDLHNITPALYKAEGQWSNEGSDQRRVADNIQQHLMAIGLEKQIINDLRYSKAVLKAHKQLGELYQTCRGSSSCSETVSEMLMIESKSYQYEESIFDRWMQREVRKLTKIKITELQSVEVNSERFNEIIIEIIQQAEKTILELLKIKEMFKNTSDFTSTVEKWQYERKHLPPSPLKNKARKVDVLIVSYGVGGRVGQVAQEVLSSLVSGLDIAYIDGNQALNFQELDFDIFSVKSAIFLEANHLQFPVNVAVDSVADAMGSKDPVSTHVRDQIEDIIGMDNVYAFVPRRETPLGYRIDPHMGPLDQTKRVFVTGDFYGSEAPTLSEDVLLFHLMKLSAHVAIGAQQMFPENKFLNVDMTKEEIQLLKGFFQGVLEDAQRATGIDKDELKIKSQVAQYKDGIGNDVMADVHDLLDKRARKIAGRYQEGPVKTALGWAYVVGFLPFCSMFLNATGIIGLSMSAVNWVTQKIAGVQGTIFPTDGLGLGMMLSLEGIATLTLLNYIFPLAYRWLYLDWKKWDRMSAPSVITTIGVSSFGSMQKFLIDVIFSQGRASMTSQTRSIDAEKNGLGEEYPSAGGRGAILNFHLPIDESSSETAQNVIRQLKVSRTEAFSRWIPILGWLGKVLRLRSSAYGFATHRGTYDSKQDLNNDLADEHMTLGGAEHYTVPKESGDGIRRFAKLADHFGAHFAQQVMWVNMINYLTFNGRVWVPTTFGRVPSHSTEAGPAPPEQKPHERIISKKKDNIVLFQEAIANDVEVDSSKHVSSTDSAMMQRKGGIDMDGRLVDLNVKGQMPPTEFNDKAMLQFPISGMIPQVGEIIPVTQNMLKAMLGDPVLN